VAAVGFVVWKACAIPTSPAASPRPWWSSTSQGGGAQQVSELLADKGLLQRPAIFRLYAGQRGVASRFKAGHYRIQAPATPRQLLESMIKGSADELVAVTIPPGKTILDVAELLDKAGITPKAELIAKAMDPAFVRSLEIVGPSLEGYLYPDTYSCGRTRRRSGPWCRWCAGTARCSRSCARPTRGVAALRKNLGFDDAKIVTLASIVEKETGRAEERARIAQLYLNRLQKPELPPRILQADPTIIYGCAVAPLYVGGKASAACTGGRGTSRPSTCATPRTPTTPTPTRACPRAPSPPGPRARWRR
jgi:UPF0755 protein